MFIEVTEKEMEEQEKEDYLARQKFLNSYKFKDGERVRIRKRWEKYHDGSENLAIPVYSNKEQKQFWLKAMDEKTPFVIVKRTDGDVHSYVIKSESNGKIAHSNIWQRLLDRYDAPTREGKDYL